MGDEMTDTQRKMTDRTRLLPAVLITGFVLLIVSAAGAADRVVLGEYFTNIY
jgi:hypothetical protein